MNLHLSEISITEDELKKILVEIKNGKRTWQEENQNSLVKAMLRSIGSVDSALRDELIYGSFYELILEKNLLNHSLLTILLDDCLNELLWKDIGESESDLVFTRSFTSLLIALIIFRDNKDNFLSVNKVVEIKDNLIAYLSAEKDLRGYVPEKGWAHSVAHVADAIDELVKNPKISKESYIEILEALWQTIFQAKNVYINDEDERILVPIVEMLDNGLEVQAIEALIQKIPMELKNQMEQLDEERYRILVFNCKTFLKSFYIKINEKPNFVALNQSIKKCLTELC